MKKLVIVCEDEEFICSLIRDALESLYEVKVFEYPVECLNYVKGDKPDVLIADIRLSGMSGCELGQKVLEMYSDMKIIYMSGADMLDLSIKRPFHNQIAFLSKPFGVKAIRNLVDIMLNEVI